MPAKDALRSSDLLICSLRSCRSDKLSNGGNLSAISSIAISPTGQKRTATYVGLNAYNFIAVHQRPLDDADVRQAACSATAENHGDDF